MVDHGEDQREAGAEATGSAKSTRDTQGILDEADQRDKRAEARDSVADDRDTAASLHTLLNGDDPSAAPRARRSAALDRLDAKADRSAAAKDRTELTRAEETQDQHPRQ